MAKRTQAKRKPAAKSSPAKRGASKPRPIAAAKGRAATPRRKTPAAKAPRRRAGGAARFGQLAAEQAVRADALNLLEQDHREVESLFAQFKQLEDARLKAAMAEKICLLLRVHTQIEEEILYPAAREAMDEQDQVDEAEVEHASAKALIADIEAMQPRDHLFDAKVNVLGEYIHHHVEEEERDFFPGLRDTELDFYEIGDALMARRLALLAELTGKA